MLNPYPSSAVSLINEHPTFTAREQNIAYRIMKQVTDLPHQENFIAFVRKESMMNVSKYLSQLIVNP